MPVYQYEAFTAGGEKSAGVLEAESPRDAKMRLRQQNLHVTRLAPASFVQRRATMFAQLGRFSRGRLMEVESVTRQLSLLLENEVKLTDALNIVMAEVSDKKMNLALRDIRDRVANGSSVGDAMGPHEWLFGQMYISMVHVGETAGTLPEVLRKMAEHLRERATRQGQLTTVMIYPMVMVCAAIGVIVFLMWKVFPEIRKVIEGSGGRLPLPTQLLIFLSNTVTGYYFVIFPVLAGLLIVLAAALRTARGRRTKDALLLRVPVLGDLIRKTQTAQFTSTLQTLLASGVKMADSMVVLLDTTNNTYMRDTIEDLRESIMRGSDVSTVLRRSRIFPRGIAHMVAVGEQSGELEQVLGRLTTNMNAEVELTITRLNAILQPVIVIALAVIVGFIVAAVMLPILEMGHLQNL